MSEIKVREWKPAPVVGVHRAVLMNELGLVCEIAFAGCLSAGA